MSKDRADFELLRHRMVEEQLVPRGISDSLVLEAMKTVPRHLFVPEEMINMAYYDGPLSIGEGQTISQPYIVALMTQLLQLKGHEKVLEIGCGSGYQAAVIACIVEKVITIERHAVLADIASERLAWLGFDNVTVIVGDGTLGSPAEAPYDAAIITAAAPDIPPPILEQLVDEGRVVAPVGSLSSQVLQVMQRRGAKWHTENSVPVMFVPLIGEHGWDQSRSRFWG